MTPFWSAYLCSRSKSTATVSQTDKISDLAPEDTLWVDRYRPRKFTELLGNERVARETMAWVKQWDWCVFGNKKRKKRLREDDENYNPDDEYHRPREKVIPLQCNTMCLFIMTFD
jgi:chromosome transmission fidelity protein 18